MKKYRFYIKQQIAEKLHNDSQSLRLEKGKPKIKQDLKWYQIFKDNNNSIKNVKV